MSFTKVVKTNHIIEIYEYDNLFIGGGGGNVGAHTEETKEENYNRTIKARRDNVRRLATMNFDVKYSKFITLTFGQCDFDTTSPIETDKRFKLFIMRLKRYLAKYHPTIELKYLAVLEYQKRGAIHYHMICNLPFIQKKQLAELWGHGFVKINAIDKVDNIGAYVVKYMTKEKADSRLKGFKGYLHSRNLKEPIVLKNWDKLEKGGCISTATYETIYAITESMATKKPVYHWELTNEHHTITYSQYNLAREENQDNVTQKDTNNAMNDLFGVGNWRLTDNNKE